MSVISANPPITTLSFKVESRTDATPKNYESELTEWAGTSPDRLIIAEQIRQFSQQGGENPGTLRLIDLNVYAEAPPLPPYVNEVVLVFISTDVNYIQGVIKKLVNQAIETIPEDYRLDIYIGSQNFMNESQVQSLIDDIYKKSELTTTRNDILVKPLEASETGKVSVIEPGSPAVTQPVAQAQDSVPDEQIEGCQAPVNTPRVVSKAATPKENDVAAAIPNPAPVTGFAAGVDMSGWLAIAAKQPQTNDVPAVTAPVVHASKKHNDVSRPPETSVAVKRKENDINAEKDAAMAIKRHELAEELEDEFEPGLPRTAASAASNTSASVSASV